MNKLISPRCIEDRTFFATAGPVDTARMDDGCRDRYPRVQKEFPPSSATVRQKITSYSKDMAYAA